MTTALASLESIRTPVLSENTPAMFRIAAYLQAHPYKDIEAPEAAARADVAVSTASKYLRQFSTERPDVHRPRRGVYRYEPQGQPQASSQAHPAAIEAFIGLTVPLADGSTIVVRTPSGSRLVADDSGTAWVLTPLTEPLPQPHQPHQP